MAVVDKYVNAELADEKLADAIGSVGQKTITLVQTGEIAAADSDDSVYRFFKDVPSNYIPVEISIMCDEITGGTDYELGLYKTNGGAAVDIDVLMGTQTLASALTRATGHQLGLAAVGIEDATKTLGELSGQTVVDSSYDIALTANTVGSADGTVTILATFAQG